MLVIGAVGGSLKHARAKSGSRKTSPTSRHLRPRPRPSPLNRALPFSFTVPRFYRHPSRSTGTPLSWPTLPGAPGRRSDSSHSSPGESGWESAPRTESPRMVLGPRSRLARRARVEEPDRSATAELPRRPLPSNGRERARERRCRPARPVATPERAGRPRRESAPSGRSAGRRDSGSEPGEADCPVGPTARPPRKRRSAFGLRAGPTVSTWARGSPWEKPASACASACPWAERSPRAGSASVSACVSRYRSERPWRLPREEQALALALASVGVGVGWVCVGTAVADGGTGVRVGSGVGVRVGTAVADGGIGVLLGVRVGVCVGTAVAEGGIAVNVGVNVGMRVGVSAGTGVAEGGTAVAVGVSVGSAEAVRVTEGTGGVSVHGTGPAGGPAGTGELGASMLRAASRGSASLGGGLGDRVGVDGGRRPFSTAQRTGSDSRVARETSRRSIAWNVSRACGSSSISP